MLVDLSSKEECVVPVHISCIYAFLLSALPVVRGIVGIDGEIVFLILLKFDFAPWRLGWGGNVQCLRVLGGTHNLRITYCLIELVNKLDAVLQPIW